MRDLAFALMLALVSVPAVQGDDSASAEATCPAGEAGVEPYCSHATPVPCAPGEVGQDVEFELAGGPSDTAELCFRTPVVCTLPTVGVEPLCSHASLQPCPAGEAGAMVVYQAFGGTLHTFDACRPVTTPDPKVGDNHDGTCTVYQDDDHDGAVDAGESVASTSCWFAKVQDNGDGTYTVYEDSDKDGTLDSGEAIVTTGVQDGDGDLVPDSAEPTLCANENPNLGSEGHCVGSDYVPPTADDVIADVLWLLGG